MTVAGGARAAALGAAWLWIAAAALSAQAYDVLIRAGRLLDGSGNPWRASDLAIDGDRIVAMGDLADATGRLEIPAGGLYVAPGFIDVHSHAAPGLASSELSGAVPLLAQGVTVVVVNPDGGGPIDLARQREQLLAEGLGVNVALLVPHAAVREAVLGMEDRAPDRAELERMRALVGAGMEAGAFGLSSGLFYAPGSYARTAELVELARVAAASGGVYTSHIRDEADYTVGVVAAVDEVIRIAEEAGLPGIVTHVKVLGPRVWGFSGALVLRVEQARARGVEVYADQYPYDASGTSIAGALIPRWVQVGGREALLRRLADPAERARVRAEVIESLDRRGGAERLVFGRYPPDPAIEGRSLASVAQERRVHAADLALDLLDGGDASLVSFNMTERDIATFMRQPWTMTSSDGDLSTLGTGHPHPRWYGTFPRKIRKYVLEDGVIGLEDAVRSMTSLAAGVFGLADRGTLRVGALADVVVFDLERLRDVASYEDPHRLSEGVVWVLVNGEVAVAEGKATGVMAGQVLRRARGDGGQLRAAGAHLEVGEQEGSLAGGGLPQPER
ncbi:MAG TPA: amidohydrolase family protein [Thermoanaerobaculia bacterium]|nr:amidohydrolase family protein [Thermoanaerobaculia bacterium]